MDLPYDVAFLKALALSLAIELPVVWLIMRKVIAVTSEAVSTSRLLLSALLATATTLPYAWYVGPQFISYDGFRQLGVEVLIALVEAGIYRLTLRLSWSQCLWTAVLANFASWGVGKLLWR